MDSPGIGGTNSGVVVPELNLEQETAGGLVAAAGIGAVAAAAQRRVGRASFNASESKVGDGAKGEETQATRHFCFVLFCFVCDAVFRALSLGSKSF